MSRNKRILLKLENIYGKECFITKLKLRPPESTKHYTSNKKISKKQQQIQKKLTFHHIIEKSKNGETSIKNGAILSRENHDWFNKQSPKVQNALNKIFQEYKKISIEKGNSTNVEKYLELREDFNKALSNEINKRHKKFSRAKEKNDFKKMTDDFLR